MMATIPLDDWELLQAYAREHSQEAFGQLVAKYADMVFHTALRRTKNRALAEDVTQAVFIVLARSAPHLRRAGSLGAWLHKTTMHAASNAIRAESRRRKREIQAAQAEVVRQLPEESDDNLISLLVDQELDRLPKADREVLAVHYLEGLTITQTAKKLGLSEGAAQKRLSRAMARLRTRLSQRQATIGGIEIISGALSRMSVQSSHGTAAPIRQIAIAGGKDGHAFQLASELLRSFRLTALGKAAAIVALLFGGVAGITLAQRDATPPPAPPAPVVSITTQPANIEFPAEIRAALERNAAQLNPITVTWTTHSESQLSVEDLMKVMKLDHFMADSFRNRRFSFVVTSQDGKFIGLTHQEWADSKSRPGTDDSSLGEVGFDGEIYTSSTSYIPKHANWPTEIRISTAKQLGGAPGNYLNSDYFHSIKVSLPPGMGQPPQSQILGLLKSSQFLGAEQLELNGHKTIRIRLVAANPVRAQALNTDVAATEKELREGGPNPPEYVRAVVDAVIKRRTLPEKRVYQFYLDPQLNYAIRRAEELYEDGTLLSRTDFDDFEKVPQREVYLPRKIVDGSYETLDVGVYPKEPPIAHILEVSNIDTDRLPDEQFRLRHLFQPGVLVLDGSGDKNKRYLIGEDGSEQPAP